MSINRKVSVIYQDLLDTIHGNTFLKGIVIFILTTIGVKAFEIVVLENFIKLHFPSWQNIIDGLSLALIIGILLLVFYFHRKFKKISHDCNELETMLSIYKKSHDISKSLITEMRRKAYSTTGKEEEKNTIKHRIDPKLFSSLDYGKKIVTKTPPPVRLDDDYIDDIFHPQTDKIYALWTEEPSVWLDPMMQFYLTNIGIRNLKDWFRTNTHRHGDIEIYDSDSDAYKQFKQLNRTVHKSFRLFLLKQEWAEQYKDELAILLAICELFRIPCYFLCKEKAMNYLKINSEFKTILERNLSDIDGLVKNKLGANVTTNFRLDLNNSIFDVMGLLIIKNTQNKFYIFTDDPSRPFKAVIDDNSIAINLFTHLLNIYDNYTDSQITIPQSHLNNRHVLIN